jgi:hypothetical protein
VYSAVKKKSGQVSTCLETLLERIGKGCSHGNEPVRRHENSTVEEGYVRTDQQNTDYYRRRFCSCMNLLFAVTFH